MSRRWALFLSGRGSTAQALLDQLGELDVACVVSSKRKAPGALRARRAGLPVLFLNQGFSWDALEQELRRRHVERILLVGFMRIVPADFVKRWRGRIFNVHPSLLPAYPGAESMRRSFADAHAEMGVTLHEVTDGMDEGPSVLRAKIARGDWPQTELRMARLEQRLLRELALRENRRRLV